MAGTLEPVEEVEGEEKEGGGEDEPVGEDAENAGSQASARECPIKENVEVMGDWPGDKTSVDEERPSNIGRHSLRLCCELCYAGSSTRDDTAGDTFRKQGAQSQQLPVRREDGLNLKVAVGWLGRHVWFSGLVCL